jgi:hypothetical protein
MPVTIYISCVGDEFRGYRDILARDLTRHNVAVKTAHDFRNVGRDTLDSLDVYIAHCDAVVHMVGDMTGVQPPGSSQDALLRKYPDLTERLPPLGKALESKSPISYVEWEAWLALYHRKLLFIARPNDAALRDARFAPTENSCAAQVQHLTRLKEMNYYPECTFSGPDDLAKNVFGGAILDLVARAYAEEPRSPIRDAVDKVRGLTGGDMSTKVFLCHSSGDKPKVRRLYHKLKKDGVKPWLDEVDLLPGQDWQIEIKKSVRNSDMIIVFLSKTSTNKDGFVQKEIKYALDIADEKPDGTVFIIPAKLEQCDVPDRLSQWHWVNIYEDGGYRRLLRTLRQGKEQSP